MSNLSNSFAVTNRKTIDFRQELRFVTAKNQTTQEMRTCITGGK